MSVIISKFALLYNSCFPVLTALHVMSSWVLTVLLLLSFTRVSPIILSAGLSGQR
jgi:hypothetical protein